MKNRDVIITKEQLTEWVSQLDSDGDCDATDHQLVALIRQSLVAMNSEPVAVVDIQRGRGDGKKYALCYTSAGHSLPDDVYNLYVATQPVPERDQIRLEHAEWSQATFGNVGPVGPLRHLSKEALEAAADPSDSHEWADMQFLLWDAQRRMGISDEFITRAMIEKLAINKARQWPEPKDGEPRLHIKEQSDLESCAIADVIAERKRQQSVKGFSTEQDDTYTGGELAGAAISYITPFEAMTYWPADWHDDSFKPTSERRNLVKAAALIIAEIERIDRKSDAELTNE